MASSVILASGLSGAIGGRLVKIKQINPPPAPASFRTEYTFVEFGGRISSLDPATRVLTPRGTGYTELEDIVVTADAKTAYVTERGGNIYRLDYTQTDLSKAVATVVLAGQAAPHQMALDEPRGLLYFVEFAGGTLKSLNLATSAVKTIVAGLAGPVGLILDKAAKIAFVSLNTSGKLLAIDLATAALRPLASGLVAPFFLSWADAQRHLIFVPERAPANRVRVFNLKTGQLYYAVRLGAPAQPSCAIPLGTRDLLVNGNDRVVEFRLAPGWLSLGALKLAETAKPFLNSFQRVTINFGTTGLAIADVQFHIDGGLPGGQISLSRDALTNPAVPEILLLAGCELGQYNLQMTETSTGTVIAEVAYTITDLWTDENVGPSLWGQGEFKQFTRNPTWGGGPSGPQNINVIPATGTRKVCIVMVDTSSTQYPSGSGYTTVRDRWFNESVGGVVGSDGVTRSVKIYYENMSHNAFSVALVGNQVFGPVSLSGAWTDYMTLEASDPPPATQNTTTFDPNNGFASAVVAAANALVDGSGHRLIDFTQVQSLIMVVRSNGAQFVWPQAWGETFNVLKLNGDSATISVPVLAMPDDWNPTHDSREIHETLSHELGHNLGMGDMYAKSNYSSPIAARSIDTYDLMAQENPLPYVSAAHRMMLGWVQSAWVRSFDFSGSGARDEIVTLAAIEIGAPPGGQFSVIEIRIADGHNYYFEYRAGQVAQIGDRQLGNDGRSANQAVLGTDVVSDTNTAPYARPMILRLRKDAEGEDSFFLSGQNYKETDTDEPNHFSPADFQMDVQSVAASSATVRIRYGANSRPDPSIRPWPGGDDWQSPDIEIRNDRNATHPEWFNMPWADHHNTIVAKVRNRGNILAPQVRVDFSVKDFTVSGAPESFLDSVVLDVPAGGAPVEFTTDWVPAGDGHRCIIARIPLYQDPGNPAVVELSQLNNEAQSNYTRFISASSSPSSREFTYLSVSNPYSRRAKIAVIPQQSGPVAKYYRTYLGNTTLMLNPGETRKVLVMFESLAGLPEVMAELIHTEFLKRFYAIDHHVSFVGLGYDPDVKKVDAPEILGGAMVAVKSGRATRFEAFKPEQIGNVRGRVVTVDDGSPAVGSVLVTAILHNDIRLSKTVNLPLDAEGFFADDSRLRRLTEKQKITGISAHYPGAPGFGACDAKSVKF